jgi:hypothetical protein
MTGARHAPKLYTSPRFLRSFDDASPGLRHLTRGAVHDLVRTFRSDPRTWRRRFDRVAAIKSPVIEIDVAKGERMLAIADGSNITLLDVGDHTLVSKAKRIDIDSALRDVVPADEHFYPDQSNNKSLYQPKPTTSIFDFGSELDPAWLYRLDEEQSLANQRLQDLLVEQVVDESLPCLSAIVTGGPGTGKTSLLACLAEYAVNRLGLRVRLVASEGVTGYLQRSTLGVVDWGALVQTSRPDLIVIDDPSSLTVVETGMARAGSDTRLVVAAFDTQQLERTLADAELDAFVSTYESEVFWLHDCYRQKENVGRVAKQVWDAIAAKTPYRRQDRRDQFRMRHRSVTERANDVRFTNPMGYTQIYDDAHGKLLVAEMERVFKSGRFVSHWPTILMVVEGFGRYQVSPLQGLPFSLAFCGFHEVETVKGLEFAHVFIIVSKRTYTELLRTDNGPGSTEYAKQRLLRIPFSRARDSLVTFVVEDGTEPVAWLQMALSEAGGAPL